MEPTATAATAFIEVTGSVRGLNKLSIFCKEFDSWAPCLAEAGTNPSWQNGVEVAMFKEAIKRDY
eukprot:5335533-Pyramimonas_sp.AAC.1